MSLFQKICERFATLECVILLPGSTGWGTVCLKILTRPHITQLGCNNPGKCNWKWNPILLKFLPLKTQNQYEKYFSLFSHQNYQTNKKDELADLLSFHDYFVLFRPVDSNSFYNLQGSVRTDNKMDPSCTFESSKNSLLPLIIVQLQKRFLVY